MNIGTITIPVHIYELSERWKFVAISLTELFSIIPDDQRVLLETEIASGSPKSYAIREMQVPLVLGIPVPGHVSWECPYCKRIHYTDIQEGDDDDLTVSPQIWWCENSTNDSHLVLIMWDMDAALRRGDPYP
jgi:hypothetical protein